MTRTRWGFFVVGIVLIAIGGYGLLTHTFWSGVVNSIFSISGVMMSFAQMVLPPGVISAGTAGSNSAPPLPPIGPTSALNVPRTYRGSGIALLLGGLCLGIQGFLALSNPNGNLALMLNVLELIEGIIILCGLPGFHAKQANKAGWLGVVGLVTIIAAWLINILISTIYIANFNPGSAVPSSVFTLYNVNLYFIILGDILLGIGMIRAAVYPRWTGMAVMAIGFAGIIVAILPLANANISMTISVLCGLLLAAFYIRCGFLLLS